MAAVVLKPGVADFPAAGGGPRTGQWRAAAGSRTGSKRSANEDRWLVVPAAGRRPLLVAVADGVGGEAAGERASAAALDAMEAAWRGWRPVTDPDKDAAAAVLREAAQAADAAVRRLTRSDPRFARAATTLTAAALGATWAAVVHAGDSRAYRLDPAGPSQITQDHSWVAEEVAAGRLDATAVARHPMRNVITRCLGLDPPCEFDVSVTPLGDLPDGVPAGVLVCSDGVTNVLDDAELAPGAVHERAADVVNRALAAVARRDGPDDATLVVALRGSEEAGEAEDPFGLRGASPHRTSLPAANRRALIAVGTAGGVLLAAGGAAWAAPRLRGGLAGAIASLSRTPPEPAAQDYLEVWQSGQVDRLYDRLTAQARRAVDQDSFLAQHQQIATDLTLTHLTAAVAADQAPVTAQPGEADVPFDAVYATARFGELRRRGALPLVWEGRQWRVAWTPAVVFPDLAGGRTLRAFSDATSRGAVVDRQGRPLAVSAPAPGSGGGSGASSGKPVRQFPAGATAGPLVGYTGEVTADDLKQLAGRGLLPGDEIGRAGVEAAAETVLAGQRGARLAVAAPSGELVSTLSAVPARAGENVWLTLDLDLQREVEDALGNRAGSVVVLDPTDGAIRALATYPRYDPNAFVTGEGVAAILNDSSHPLVDRPVQGLYPPGSIFKVVTMAAGLESGAFQPESQFTCTGRWTGLPGVSMNCWLATGHGKIDLVSGLTQSCDVVFYELGKRLDEINADLLPSMAKRCGLGAPTGALPEEEPDGIVPGPAWKPQALKEPWTRGDAVNMAIGQGQVLVTPLQMAAVYGAIAAGGTLRGPRLLDRAVASGGNVERLLSASRQLALGWSQRTLDAIRTGLKNVVAAPNGTAAFVFQGSPLAAITAGKTGSAETVPGRDTHAWFVCFAPFDAPKVVVLAMLEYGGEGSGVAAPLARRVLEIALR